MNLYSVEFKRNIIPLDNFIWRRLGSETYFETKLSVEFSRLVFLGQNVHNFSIQIISNQWRQAKYIKNYPKLDRMLNYATGTYNSQLNLSWIWHFMNSPFRWNFAYKKALTNWYIVRVIELSLAQHVTRVVRDFGDSQTGQKTAL